MQRFVEGQDLGKKLPRVTASNNVFQVDLLLHGVLGNSAHCTITCINETVPINGINLAANLFPGKFATQIF